MRTLGREEIIRRIDLAGLYLFLAVRVDLRLRFQLQVRFFQLIRGLKSELKLAERPAGT